MNNTERTRALLELQEAYPKTEYGLLLFAQRCIFELIVGNPSLNRMQADILKFLFGGNKYRGIEANRGIAKTTLAGIYCCFRLIHEPWVRIIVFSQNSRRSKEISGWVIKIMMNIPELECLRPDRHAGDRASLTEGFDVHGSLKGQDKSPSVAAYSIEGGAQGARADIILADDVESLQNSKTVQGREWLEEITKEFESINQTGDIIYLGTPQSVNSIYNNLPSRGYELRIWTGRYPTPDEVPTYNGLLAPIILRDIEKNPDLQVGGGFTGEDGQPTAPEMFPEEILQEKELSQGKAKFKLQYMLNTALTDSERFPLKLSNLIVSDFTASQGQEGLVWGRSPQTLIQDLPRLGSRPEDLLYAPITPQGGYYLKSFTKTVMYIDPAGGGKNGDETAYAIVKLLSGCVYLYDIGAIKGGFEPEELIKLVMAAKDAEVHEVFMEKNFGNGAHYHLLKPLFDTIYPVRFPEDNLVWETGQKELRIIDVIEPVLSGHRLVVRKGVVEKDLDLIEKYPVETRKSYSLFSQMSNITRDKDCLLHDDRLDALAGAVREILRDIAFDTESFIQRHREATALAQLKAWSDPVSRREWLGVAYSDAGRKTNASSHIPKKKGKRKWGKS